MKKSFAYPYGVWLAVFILAPILMVVVYAFLNADGGFTLHNFSYLPGYLPIFGRSFWLAFLSTVVCLALGYPMAYLMSCLSASKQSLCMMLIMLPMWINFLLRTYAWMSILENNGFINQFFRSIGLISFLQSHSAIRWIISRSSTRRARSCSAWCTTSCRSWCCRSTPCSSSSTAS